jgi:hypothetical protein
MDADARPHCAADFAAELEIEITCDEYDAVKNSKGLYTRIIRVDGSMNRNFDCHRTRP